jgi:NAD(P)-dependent dehydrogenase (short-subunit alcohol dehydrogenase family)
MTKALLVTGGSRGIGRAGALLAAKRGWSVGVNFRADGEAAATVVHEIAREGGRAVALGRRRQRGRCRRHLRTGHARARPLDGGDRECGNRRPGRAARRHERRAHAADL